MNSTYRTVPAAVEEKGMPLAAIVSGNRHLCSWGRVETWRRIAARIASRTAGVRTWPGVMSCETCFEAGRELQAAYTLVGGHEVPMKPPVYFDPVRRLPVSPQFDNKVHPLALTVQRIGPFHPDAQRRRA